jgi:hypothetical protein
MPPVDMEWSPPSLVVGDVKRLAEVLRTRTGAGVVPSGELDLAALKAALEALAPALELTPRASTPVLGVLGPVPLVVERKQGLWSGEGVVVDEDFLTRARADGDGTVLVLGEAPIDKATWQRQPALVEGDCEPVLEAIGTGQGQSLAIIEPFLDEVDERLAEIHRKELAKVLPTVRATLERTAKGDDEHSECARAWLAILVRWERAHAEADPLIPRIYLAGSPRIAVIEPSAPMQACTAKLDPDPGDQLGEPARIAARTVAPQLAASSSEPSSRVAALDEVHAALEDLCRPRRRRYAESDVQVFRARLERAMELYRDGPATIDASASWQAGGESFHVSGIGAATSLFEFRAGRDAPAPEIVGIARGLRELGLVRARCQAEPNGLPLAVAVIDVSSGTLDHFDYLYEEELVCRPLSYAGSVR